MARKRRSADPPTTPPRRQLPRLLPGSPRARWDAHGNIANAAYLSEAALALAQGMPRVLSIDAAPAPPAPRQQLAIHTRGQHVDHPHVATSLQSGRRTAPRHSAHTQRYTPYARAPPYHFAAHQGAGYAPPAVTAPASRIDFVQPQQQQYHQYQHYPQHHFGNVLSDADLIRFPSNSSQATLGHGPSNAMGPQPSGNAGQEDVLRPEDFEEAGLNLEAVQTGVPDENGGDAQYQSDFLDFQKFLLHSSGDMTDGSYSLNQMASRPIFHPYPAPAPTLGYQQPLPEPTFTNYNIAGAYQSPYAPTMYAPQQAQFQPTFQPGTMYAPGPVNNVVMQQAGPMYAPGSVNNNFVQQPGTMYAPGYVENFVVQQPRPTARPRSEAMYPVSYATTEEWVEAQRRREKRVSEGEDADGKGDEKGI